MSIEKLLKEFSSLELAKKELRNIQTKKCRFRKQKQRKDYDLEMSKILKYEQDIKEVVNYFEPKKVTTTTMTLDQVQDLNYDETIKALKSIQSKKCNSQYNIDKSEYEKSLEIEKMLKEHRNNIKPIEDTVVKKSRINDIIDHIEKQENKIKKEYIIKLLQDLVNEQ